MPEWALRFENFSALHLATVLFFAALWLALVVIGRRVAGGPARGALAELLLRLDGTRLARCQRRAAAAIGLRGLGEPPAADLRHRRHPGPAGLVAAFPAAARGTLFLGAGIQRAGDRHPDLHHGPASIAFWMFWIPHANITGAAVYALVVEGFRPRWRECAQAYALALLYLALILPFDLLTGFNYGYVGPVTLPQPTLLDLLGPLALAHRRHDGRRTGRIHSAAAAVGDGVTQSRQPGVDLIDGARAASRTALP